MSRSACKRRGHWQCAYSSPVPCRPANYFQAGRALTGRLPADTEEATGSNPASPTATPSCNGCYTAVVLLAEALVGPPAVSIALVHRAR